MTVGHTDQTAGRDDHAGDDPDLAPSVPALRRALDPLDAMQRDVLVLRYLAELDELRVADVLAVRPATAQHRVAAALAGLRSAAAPARAMSEQELVGLVEQHRQDHSVSLPPPDLLDVAHDLRRRHRQRAAGITAAVVA